jgi:hypothetical protein
MIEGSGSRKPKNIPVRIRIRPHILYPPDLILYEKLVAKGAPKFLRPCPRLTVLDIPYFADGYSRTVHPIYLKNL